MENFSPKEIPETFWLQWVKKKSQLTEFKLNATDAVAFAGQIEDGWQFISTVLHSKHIPLFPPLLWNQIKYNNDLSVFLEETWSTVLPLFYFVHLQPMWVAMALPHLSIQDQSWPKFLMTVYPAKTKMACISTCCPYIDKTNRTGTGFFVYS